MEITEDVISQGIVVISILAGFSFAISAELLMRRSLPKVTEKIAAMFAIGGLASIVTALIGIMYFGSPHLPAQRGDSASTFLALLLGSISWFIYTFLYLVTERVEDPVWKTLIKSIGYLVVAILILTTVVFVFPPTRS